MGLEAAPEREELWNLDYGISLPDKFTVKPVPYKKGCKYDFFNEEKRLINELKGETPLSITERSTVGVEIKKHLNPNGTLNKLGVTQLFDDLKVAMNSFVDEYVEVELETQKQNEEEELAQNKQSYEEGLELFRNQIKPLIYTASLVDWYTAGERINIMITFLCYCSQVILKNPISVIGLGDGSSGKTHIENVALSMIPEEFIIYEKKPTMASMFRRAETDQRYYDGKIVVYGDLGGDSDQDEVEETKNLLKELQTDGYLARPITIKVDGEYEVVDLILSGFPCLTYTTVPNYSFDSQELSRSFIFTPRTDNRAVFNARKSYLELKGGKTEQIYQSMLCFKSEIQKMVLGLRYKFSDVTIVNPYSDAILNLIGASEYYKRDYDKYNGILKVITAFNSTERDVHIINGEKVIFTNPEDLQYFVSLLKPYMVSIKRNLSKKAAELLEDIEENIDKWEYQPDSSYKFDPGEDFGFTINDYIEEGNVNIAKRSLYRYFTELNQEGFLKVVGKHGKSNMYALVENVDEINQSEMLLLSESSRHRLELEYPDDIVSYIFLNDVILDENCSILNQSDDVSKPFWLDYDED
ncbi:hypothetical protein [uncultured Methanobrevibacter sp.]|uniref:hypothetical protein n=1 Tax=uncultured Methanobrevibacter sp. TaxID=253161 RepID=UPI0025D45801|nr:hypothetical protein [uncultured Methanobrevibacter sp.]